MFWTGVEGEVEFAAQASDLALHSGLLSRADKPVTPHNGLRLLPVDSFAARPGGVSPSLRPVYTAAILDGAGPGMR